MPPSSLIWGSPHLSIPVALDKACADMVINAPIIGGNKLAETHPHEHLEGEDKFHLIHSGYELASRPTLCGGNRTGFSSV